MQDSSRGGLRCRMVLSVAGVAMLGGVVAAGPAAADWPAPGKGFRIASVGISGQCVAAVGEVVGLQPCTQPVSAEQTWSAIDGAYASRLRNAATGRCVLSDNGFRNVECGSAPQWRYVLVNGYVDRAVIHLRQSGRGALTCWQAFTGSSGAVLSGGIRPASACDSIKGDQLPTLNMWTLTSVS